MTEGQKRPEPSGEGGAGKKMPEKRRKANQCLPIQCTRSVLGDFPAMLFLFQFTFGDFIMSGYTVK